jgi:molybdopterin-binding protein
MRVLQRPISIIQLPDYSITQFHMIVVDILGDTSRMDLLTVRQAAARLGIGYSTLKQWIYLGRVRTRTTSGGHHRIPEAEVDRLLAPGAPSKRQAPRPRSGVIVALSGRNQLSGFVDEVRVEGLLAQVRLRIGDQFLTAVITRDGVDELKLRRGDQALAIVKATEVMIGREANADGRSRRR